MQPGHVHLTGVGGVGKTEEAILLERLQRFQWSGGPRFRVMRTITDRAERQELVNDLRREEMSHLYDTICTGKRIDAAAFKPWQSSGDVNCWKTLDTTYLWPITSKGRDALLDELFAQGIRLRERDVEAIFPIYDAILEGDVVFTLSASAASAQYAHDVARRKGVPTRTYMLSDHDKEKTVARFLTKYSKGESYLGPDVRRSIQAAYHEALNAPHEQARDELFTSRIDMIDRWHSRERPAEMRLVTGEGYALPIKRIRLLRSIEASLQELPFITKVIRGPGLYDRHRLLVKELQQYHEVGA